MTAESDAAWKLPAKCPTCDLALNKVSFSADQGGIMDGPNCIFCGAKLYPGRSQKSLGEGIGSEAMKLRSAEEVARLLRTAGLQHGLNDAAVTIAIRSHEQALLEAAAHKLELRAACWKRESAFHEEAKDCAELIRRFAKERQP